MKRKKNNKDLIQSYIFTTAKYDFSAYEKRIIYRQIEIEQALLEGQKIGDGVKIDTNLWGDKRYTIPLKWLLKDEKDKNYSQISKAFKSLREKTILYEDENTIEGFGVIQSFKIEKRDSFVSWVAHPKIVEATMNFAKGYRKYELKVAMEFESVYAMRFYELLSGQKTPLIYSIENLKEMFGIVEKYKENKDFRIKVLEAAKKELDKCSPYTFNYEMNKTGRSFTSVTLFPKYQPQFRDVSLEKNDLQKQVSLSWDLDKRITDYLKYNFSFTTDEIKRNIDLFKEAQSKLDFINFMSLIKEKSIDKSNPKGYLINAIKLELVE